MLLTNMRDPILMLSVGVLTLWALATDLRARRIPNALTVPAFVLGFVFHAWFDGWAGVKTAGAGFGLGFGTLLILWFVGGGGAGDVKLMGALGAWLGGRLTLYVLIASTLVVVIGTVLFLMIEWVLRTLSFVKRRQPGESEAGRASRTGGSREASIQKWRERRRIMPYALPVGVATWLIMAWQLLH
ncbi:MAG: prepilin peptidase [Planctomycetes bacterium]|nr:prepilin peptidase [Planctomycetota bacterium]